MQVTPGIIFMHKRFVFNFVCRILFLVSLVMIFPLLWALSDEDPNQGIRAFGFTILLGLIFSVFIISIFKVKKLQIEQATYKDTLSIVGLSWVLLSLWGALPLYLMEVVPNYTDAVFEIVSGFTTTGSSIFKDVEILPRSILFWRSLTHWLGGLGVISFFIALFPSFGITSMRLYNFESSGIDSSKMSSQIRKTASLLWIIYIFLTIISVLLLYFNGMPIFDAICHAFGAIATGGYSTKNASIGAYGRNIQWIIIFIMVSGGVNFSFYIKLLRGQFRNIFKSEEIWLYFALLFGGSVICAILLSSHGKIFDNILDSVFQVVSIMTATGYATTDFAQWPYGAQCILLILMFVGGCVGSTSGGFKVVRVLVSFKKSFQTIKQYIYPHAIISVRLNGVALSEKIILSVMSYFIIYIVLFVFGAMLLLIFESCDIVTAISASISALSSVGPGLGAVGPMQNYAWMTIWSKWTLIFLMLAGRMELHAILLLFIPATWRK